MKNQVTLLGPQRHITFGDTARQLSPHGPVATITAGWQDREPEDAELNEHLDGRAVNLALYQRTRAITDQDAEFAQQRKEFLAEVEDLRRLYNLRLSYAMDAWTDLMSRNGSKHVVRERTEAAQVVRDLDASHVRKMTAVRRRFVTRVKLAERPAVVEHRQQVAQILSDATLVVIAGGHVGVLLERLRLFAVDRLLAKKPVVAWSAGAMVLAPLVVCFHDRPPQGPGHAEAFDRGLGLFPSVVPLPHGSRRLRLRDRDRVKRLAQRFSHTGHCVLLDPGSEIQWTGKEWRGQRAVRLTTRGTTVKAVSR